MSTCASRSISTSGLKFGLARFTPLPISMARTQAGVVAAASSPKPVVPMKRRRDFKNGVLILNLRDLSLNFL